MTLLSTEVLTLQKFIYPATDKFLQGFEYANSSFSANAKVEYPVRVKGALKLDVASVFFHGNYAVGAHVIHSLDGSAPIVEAKVQGDLGNSSISLFGKQSAKEQ